MYTAARRLLPHSRMASDRYVAMTQCAETSDELHVDAYSLTIERDLVEAASLQI